MSDLYRIDHEQFDRYEPKSPGHIGSAAKAIKFLTASSILVPVEPVTTVKVGDIWDDELWLPRLVERGTIIAVVRIGTWDYDPEWRTKL